MTTANQRCAAMLAAASAVTALVGTRYWPDKADTDQPALPYITWQVISEVRNDHIDLPGRGKRARIQINCYAATRAGADALGNAVEAAASTYRPGRVVLRQSNYEFDSQIYSTLIDWSTSIPNP